MLEVPEDVALALEAWRAVVEEAIGRAVLRRDALFPRCGTGLELRRTGSRPLQSMKGPSLSGLVKRRFREAGLEGPRMATHVLRATAATIAHEAGASIEEIQHTLAHATPAMTETYIRRMLAAEHECAAHLIDNCVPPGALWGWEVDDPIWGAALDELDLAMRVAILDMHGLPVSSGMRVAYRVVLEIAGSPHEAAAS